MITVTSANRTQARRMLNNWHPSARVAKWTLAELRDALQRAVNSQLITEAGVIRALNKVQDAPPPRKNDDGRDSGNDNDADLENNPQHDKDAEGDDGEPYESKEYEAACAAAKKNGARDFRNGKTLDRDRYDMSDLQEAYEDGYAQAQSRHENGEQDDDGEQDGDGNGNGGDGNGGDGDGDSEGDDDGDDDGDESEDEQEDDESKDDESEDESKDDEQEDDEQDEHDYEDDSPVEHPMLRTLIKYMKAGVQVQLVGPAGTGKSYLVRQAAEILGLSFYTHGAMLSKYDVIGYQDAAGTYHATPAYDALKDGGVLCIDEYDSSAPDAIVAINGMSDDQPFFTFPVGQTAKHDDFCMVICTNTWGNGATADYVGRCKQDAAALDRFTPIFIGYDPKLEVRLGSKDIVERVQAIRRACESLSIRHIVSLRMIMKAEALRKVGVSKRDIDRDVMFARLEDDTVRQIKTAMRNEQSS